MVAGRGGYAAPEQAVKRRPGARSAVGRHGMASGAGREDLGAAFVFQLRRNIVARKGEISRKRCSGSAVPAPHHPVAAAREDLAAIGEEGQGPQGRPGTGDLCDHPPRRTVDEDDASIYGSGGGPLTIPRHAERNHGLPAGIHLRRRRLLSREEADFSIHRGRKDFPIARNGQSTERNGEAKHARCTVFRPDAEGSVIACADHPAVRQKCDRINVTGMTDEHTGLSFVERPEANRLIPTRRGDCPAIGRKSE